MNRREILEKAAEILEEMGFESSVTTNTAAAKNPACLVTEAGGVHVGMAYMQAVKDIDPKSQIHDVCYDLPTRVDSITIGFIYY